MSYGFKIIVTGDYACFARPEMKKVAVEKGIKTFSDRDIARRAIELK